MITKKEMEENSFLISKVGIKKSTKKDIVYHSYFDEKTNKYMLDYYSDKGHIVREATEFEVRVIEEDSKHVARKLKTLMNTGFFPSTEEYGKTFRLVRYTSDKEPRTRSCDIDYNEEEKYMAYETSTSRYYIADFKYLTDKEQQELIEKFKEIWYRTLKA